MLRPNGANLLIGGEFAARSGGLGDINCSALILAQGDLRLVVPDKLQHKTRDFVLGFSGKAASGFNGAFEQFGHKLNHMPFEWGIEGPPVNYGPDALFNLCFLTRTGVPPRRSHVTPPGSPRSLRSSR
jgi:hypothetical protein